MRLSGARVAVVGLGASGVAAAELCRRQGAEVVGYDEAQRLGEQARALAERGVRLVLGPLERLEPADVVVVSPGVPRRAAIDRAEAAGVEVIGEVELASRFLDCPIVLVGGTNGKSTTTALCHEMMLAAGLTSFLGGNYGTPLSDAVGARHDVAVVELSSFQAERVPTLRARAHALLNVTDDHLDRYDGFAAYARAKGNPFVNMTADDVAVLPFGDAVCAEQAARGRARVVTFGESPAADVRVEGGFLCDLGGALHALAAIALKGKHNLANACAAAALAGAMGVASEAIGRALAGFRGLDHRCVVVGEIDGVRYYDDSKATNVGAAVAALSGLDEGRAVLIAGGRDKLGSYAPLMAALGHKGRALVLIGEAAERIAAAAAGILPVVRAATLEAAVREARQLARPGDAVLLSPACSSYDMFANYKARGDAFAAAVRALGAGEGAR